MPVRNEITIVFTGNDIKSPRGGSFSGTDRAYHDRLQQSREIRSEIHNRTMGGIRYSGGKAVEAAKGKDGKK